jgi:hypothetical protein
MLMDAVLKSRKIIADFVISRLPNVDLREMLRLVADAVFLISDLPENRDHLTFKEIRRVCLHLLATFLTSLMQRNRNNQSNETSNSEDKEVEHNKPESKVGTTTDSTTDSKEVAKESIPQADEVKTGDLAVQQLTLPNISHLLGLLTGELGDAFSSCIPWFLSKLSKDLAVDWKTNSKFLDLMAVRQPESSKLLDVCMKLMTGAKKADRRAALESLYQHLTTLYDEKPSHHSDMQLIESLLLNISNPSKLVMQILSWLETLTLEFSSKQVIKFCSLVVLLVILPLFVFVC